MGDKTVFNKILFALFFTLNLGALNATIFQPMPLEKLVDESTGAAEVELKSKKSFMNKMGLILTEYTFDVGESYNVDNSDLEGEFLKITMTGGTVNGVTSYIDGAPEFAVGEKSFLLLKKIESKIYLSNFTIGKYKIENRDGQVFYVSSVFPHDADLGQVKKERMVDLIKTKFKITRAPEVDSRERPLYESNNKKEVLKEKTFEKRAPAQASEKDPHDGLVAMWSFFALMVISGFTMWWKLRKGSKV